MEPRSITSQLVVLFTLAAAFLLSCGLGAFYWLVVRHAFTEDNSVLADKVLALSADFRRPGGPKALEDQLKNLRAGEHAAYWIRVVDPVGAVVTETPGMAPLLPVSVFPPPQPASVDIGNPKNYRVGPQLFSLVTTSEEKDGRPYVIQVAQDRSSDEQFSKEFGALVTVVLGFGILASAVIAVTVTRRGLQPLADMTHALERIGPTHLSERVAPSGWPREVRPLALAFDQMLDRLEDSFTRLSQFSADLAHELRTPIGNILGETQVALTRARTSDEYREVIESTVAECERLSAIVDNLLFVARAESAGEHIHRTRLDARAAVENIATYYRTIAEDRHIAITCSGEGEIFADSVLFGRALSNLVDNSLRHTPDGGMIRVLVATRPAHVDVSVTDSGCGIASEHLPRVFDRFYRVDPARSSHGAGLGLALVKSIVDLHGGTAKIQSELNRGTTVTLVFPKEA